VPAIWVFDRGENFAFDFSVLPFGIFQGAPFWNFAAPQQIFFTTASYAFLMTAIRFKFCALVAPVTVGAFETIANN
jgi:hypothetical protein